MGNTEQTQKKLLLHFSASLTHLNMKSSAPVRRYKDPQLKSHVVCVVSSISGKIKGQIRSYLLWDFTLYSVTSVTMIAYK